MNTNHHVIKILVNNPYWTNANNVILAFLTYPSKVFTAQPPNPEDA